MKYWQKIDLVTIAMLRDTLIEVANELDDKKRPLEELIDFSLEKIDRCIDELNWYYQEGLKQKEKKEKNEERRKKRS